jgi:hypothetical protein
MPGRPKENRVLAALAQRAVAELGDEATPLEYVVDYISGGHTLADLAVSLADELKESVSRQLISGAAHRLAPDAKERIAAARSDGAFALAEHTLTLADEAESTAGGAAKARIQVSARQWLAGKWNREFGEHAGPSVTVNFGQMMLEALQRPAPPRPAALTSRVVEDAEVLSVE